MASFSSKSASTAGQKPKGSSGPTGRGGSALRTAGRGAACGAGCTAGFGAGFGPLVICALFWKRTTFPGAVAGMVSGGVFVFIWKYLLKPMGGVWGIYELLPAFLVGLIAIVVVSLLTKAPGEEIQKEFDLAKSSHDL